MSSHSDMEAIIAGAGLSGLFVASQLQKAGLTTTIYERAQRGRKKVCGGCLNLRGVRVLERAGFGNLLDGAPQLGKAELRAGQKKISLKGNFGVAIGRRSLDCALSDAVEEMGTTIRWGATVRNFESQGRMTLTSGANFESGCIVNAAGLSGRPLLSKSLAGESRAGKSRAGGRIGLGAEVHDRSYDLEPGVVRMIFFSQGYLGLVRPDDHSLIIAAAVSPKIGRNIFAAVDPKLLPDFDPAELLATPRLTGSALPASGAVFSVGDAASYIEPVSGLGMSWALEGAEALSETLLIEKIENRAAAWTRRYARVVSAKQRWTSLAQSLISTPARMEFAAAILSRSTLSERGLRWAFSW